MKVFFHLFGRELRDQRFFFPAALLLGFLPHLVVALTPLQRDLVADVRQTAVRLLAYGILFLGGAVVGARWLLTGFADRRRDFELARPLTPGQLCAGKLAGCLALVFGGALLAAVPTGLEAFCFDTADNSIFDQLVLGSRDPGLESFARDLAYRGYRPSRLLILPAIAAAALLAMGIVQSLAFALAGRGWRTVADLGAWVGAGLLFASAGFRLTHFGAVGLAAPWIWPLAAALIVLAVAAAARSFAAGSLLGPAHRRYSRTMSLGLLALAAATAGAASYATAPRLERLESFRFAVPNAGFSRWLIGGKTGSNGYEPVYRVDLATRDIAFLAPLWRMSGEPRLSDDGRRAVFAAAWPNRGWAAAEFGDDGDVELAPLPGGADSSTGIAGFAADRGLDLLPAGWNRYERHAGLPLENLIRRGGLLALANGYWMIADRIDTQKDRIVSWQLLDSRGAVAGRFEAPLAIPVGEIRPGLLLVAVDPGNRPDCADFRSEMQEGRSYRTLVVAVPSGGILRELVGWTPRKLPATGGPRIWLADACGEPYDLADASATPRPFLPWTSGRR